MDARNHRRDHQHLRGERVGVHRAVAHDGRDRVFLLGHLRVLAASRSLQLSLHRAVPRLLWVLLSLILAASLLPRIPLRHRSFPSSHPDGQGCSARVAADLLAVHPGCAGARR